MKPLVVTPFGSDAPPRLALILREKMDPASQPWSRYWVFNADVVSLEDDGTPRNLVSDYQPLTGFGVRAQQDAERAERAVSDPYAAEPYGMEIVVDASMGGLLNLREAERILATHRTIARRMAATANRFGAPVTLAQYVLHAAEAMGISTFIVQTAPSTDGRYSTGTYSILDADEAASRVSTMVERANSALREA